MTTAVDLMRLLDRSAAPRTATRGPAPGSDGPSFDHLLRQAGQARPEPSSPVGQDRDLSDPARPEPVAEPVEDRPGAAAGTAAEATPAASAGAATTLTAAPLPMVAPTDAGGDDTEVEATPSSGAVSAGETEASAGTSARPGTAVPYPTATPDRTSLPDRAAVPGESPLPARTALPDRAAVPGESPLPGAPAPSGGATLAAGADPARHGDPADGAATDLAITVLEVDIATTRGTDGPAGQRAPAPTAGSPGDAGAQAVSPGDVDVEPTISSGEPLSPLSVALPGGEADPVTGAEGLDSTTVPATATVAVGSATAAATGAGVDHTAAVAPANLRELIGRLVSERDAAVPGNHRLVLRLDPPELGRVTLEVTTRSDTVLVVMRTEGGAAANALAAQRDQIRQALESQGLTLGDFDVRDDTQSGRSAQPDQSGKDRPATARFPDGSTAYDTEPVTAPGTGGLFL